MIKYVTIVIRADDEKAALALVPGEKINGNRITACSIGDMLTENERLKDLIPEEKEDELQDVEGQSMFAWISSR